MLSDEQLAAIIEAGYEQRAIEFKSSGSRRDRSFLALVARAVIAIANQRDGGHVIIGLSEDGIEAEASGLSSNEVAEWTSYDDVVDQINAYADPPTRLHIRPGVLPNGRAVVILEVAEFDEVPILCKKDYPGRLAARQLYTRSMAKPESSTSTTQNELREVLSLATEKQLARFVETSRRAGISISPDETRSAAAAFSNQADSVDGHDGVLAYEGQPSIVVKIHPIEFNPRFLPFEALAPAVRAAAVSSRGVHFPVLQTVHTGDDWVGDAASWPSHYEVWQFFQSGLFFDYQALDDWEPDPGMHVAEGVKRFLPVWLPLLHFTEAFEFASRLQRALMPEQTLIVHVTLTSIGGRALVVAQRGKVGMFGSYVYSDLDWSRTAEITPEVALTGTRHLAVDLTRDLCLRFGWNGVTDDLLQGIQVEALGTNDDM